LTKENLIKILSALKPGEEISRAEDIFHHWLNPWRSNYPFSPAPRSEPGTGGQFGKFKVSLEKIKNQPGTSHKLAA